jgi:hypothetical protein
VTPPASVDEFLKLPVAVRVIDAHGQVTVVRVAPDGQAFLQERTLVLMADESARRASSGMTDIDALDVDFVVLWCTKGEHHTSVPVGELRDGVGAYLRGAGGPVELKIN